MKKMKVMRFVLFVALAAILAVGCAKQPAQETPTEAPAMQEPAPAPAPAPVETKVKETEVKETVSYAASDLTRIHFDFDSYVLKPQAQKTLARNADILKALPNLKIRIEGHCDERGSDEYNLALGERRAQAAMNYLEALGIASSRMTTISYGEERPLDPGHNEEAWAKNRRAEFVAK